MPASSRKNWKIYSIRAQEPHKTLPLRQVTSRLTKATLTGKHTLITLSTFFQLFIQQLIKWKFSFSLEICIRNTILILIIDKKHSDDSVDFNLKVCRDLLCCFKTKLSDKNSKLVQNPKDGETYETIADAEKTKLRVVDIKWMLLLWFNNLHCSPNHT